jgi:hypothetical protein
MMNLVMAILLLALLLCCGALTFMRADPARLAKSLRLAGPLLLMLSGIGAALATRPVIGGALALAALALFAASRRNPPPKLVQRRHSMVRTAALEMELDHETGALEGLVLAGRAEGRTLGAMGLSELRRLYRELSSDAESLQLLETYLDCRFPVWRGDAKADGGERLSVSPGTGAMTKEEAYKVLGLETGAAAADVRKAHRRLMQRLHPEVYRASLLAARIDEAKDVLLSDHG